jgi:hypothetical protein
VGVDWYGEVVQFARVNDTDELTDPPVDVELVFDEL